jgi:ribosomal protein S18 acetylase RimI-like enzyme
MAARLYPAPSGPELVDLRHLSARDLDPLLNEETSVWSSDLDWDFSKSADLVRRFIDLRGLSGYALVEERRPIGYLYYVLEENKGLVGDLYVSRDHRGLKYEDYLLETGIDAIRQHPQIRRIESQILLLDYLPDRTLPFAADAATYERNFMRIALDDVRFREGAVRTPMFIEHWNDHYHDAAAQVIAEAYASHVDSRVNDQYRNVPGARRFLYNVVQFPGCGTFFRPASYAAFEAGNGKLCGISLASLVSPACGHITQICVSGSVRGKGVGHELLRRSLSTLQDVGCRAASLTVTAANANAVALYESVGFRTIRRFAAYAWEWA